MNTPQQQAQLDAETDIWPDPTTPAGARIAAAITVLRGALTQAGERRDVPEAPLEVPASERPASRVPELPRPIEPEDVRVGMLVERRKGEVAYRDRVQRIDGGGFISSDPTLPYMWMPGLADNGWSLWLIEDAPAPDPDREAVEAIREASWSIPPSHATAAKPDPLPGLPESRDLLHSLRAKGWDLVKRDDAGREAEQ